MAHYETDVGALLSVIMARNITIYRDGLRMLELGAQVRSISCAEYGIESSSRTRCSELVRQLARGEHNTRARTIASLMLPPCARCGLEREVQSFGDPNNYRESQSNHRERDMESMGNLDTCMTCSMHYFLISIILD